MWPSCLEKPEFLWFTGRPGRLRVREENADQHPIGTSPFPCGLWTQYVPDWLQRKRRVCWDRTRQKATPKPPIGKNLQGSGKREILSAQVRLTSLAEAFGEDGAFLSRKFLMMPPNLRLPKGFSLCRICRKSDDFPRRFLDSTTSSVVFLIL